MNIQFESQKGVQVINPDNHFMEHPVLTKSYSKKIRNKNQWMFFALLPVAILGFIAILAIAIALLGLLIYLTSKFIEMNTILAIAFGYLGANLLILAGTIGLTLFTMLPSAAKYTYQYY